MQYIFILTPFIAWIVAGSFKFCINYLRFGKEAMERVGNGGFPSTHTTVVSSSVMLFIFNQGIDNPMCAIGLAFLIVTMIDAMGIRRAVGKHAVILNENHLAEIKLRESQGHTLFEVLGGLVLGTTLAYFLNILRG